MNAFEWDYTGMYFMVVLLGSQKGFLLGFYVDFYRPNKSHLPFKDLGFIGMSIGPPYGFIMRLFEDRCEESKGVDGILKDLYKDSSWNSTGFP